MKNNEVRVGRTYSAKVSGGVVPVIITDEKWLGDQHVGWVGKNMQTGRSIRIKSAQRLRAGVGAPKATPATPAVGADAPHVGPTAAPAPQGAVTAKAGSPTPPKPTSGGKGKRSAKATGGQKAAKEPQPAKPKKPRPMSGLDAAAKVLADSGKPMHVGAVMEVIVKKGLWSSTGRTPRATLYAAIIREIGAKGSESRFKKIERGVFAANA